MSKYVKSIDLRDDSEREDDPIDAMSPNQIADALLQIDPDDLFDVQAAIDKHMRG